MSHSEIIGFLFSLVLAGAFIGDLVMLFHAIKGTHPEIEDSDHE